MLITVHEYRNQNIPKQTNMKTILLLASIITLAACNKPSLRGSGATVTEVRSVPAFNNVRVEGSGNATITQGTTASVQVTGYENLVPAYETYVTNGTLVLKFKNDYHNIRNNNISVKIVTPSLERTSINGSGSMLIKNFTGNLFQTEINGSGKVTVENSRYLTANLEVNGSGDIHAQQLTAGDVEARISGSGRIEITCFVKLVARISGSGDVFYWGNPQHLDMQVSGSGKVIRQ